MVGGRKNKGLLKKLKFWRKSDKQVRQQNIGDDRETRATDKKAKKLEGGHFSEDYSSLQNIGKCSSESRFFMLRNKCMSRKSDSSKFPVELQFQDKDTDSSNVSTTHSRGHATLAKGTPQNTFLLQGKIAHLSEKADREKKQAFYPKQEIQICQNRENGKKLKGRRKILGLARNKRVDAGEENSKAKFIFDVNKRGEEPEFCNIRNFDSNTTKTAEENQLAEEPSCSHWHNMLTTSCRSQLKGIFSANAHTDFEDMKASKKDKTKLTWYERKKVVKATNLCQENNRFSSRIKDNFINQESDSLALEQPSYETTKKRLGDESKASDFEKHGYPDIKKETKSDSTSEKSAELLLTENVPSLRKTFAGATEKNQVKNEIEIDSREQSSPYEKTEAPSEKRIGTESVNCLMKCVFPTEDERRTGGSDTLSQLLLTKDYFSHRDAEARLEEIPLLINFGHPSQNTSIQSDLPRGVPLHKVESFYTSDGLTEDQRFSIGGNTDMPRESLSQLYKDYEYIYINELKKMEALDEDFEDSVKRLDYDASPVNGCFHKRALKNCELRDPNKTQLDYVQRVQPTEMLLPVAAVQTKVDPNCQYDSQNEESTQYERTRTDKAGKKDLF